MWKRNAVSTCVLGVLAVGAAHAFVQEVDHSRLPRGASPAAIAFPYFPDRLHALVFRNWNLVDADRIARTVGATREQILAIGQSMGLPPLQAIPEEYHRRMYLTIIRRNWHLLPYDQLLTLLDMSAEELAFILREDDFLFVKLGQLKPDCQPIHYTEPTTEVARAAAHVKSIIEKSFGDELLRPAVPRFQFIRDLSEPLSADAHRLILSQQDHLPAAPRFSLRIIYSYVAPFGDPLIDERIDPFPDGLLERLAAVGVNGVWLHVVLRDLAPGGTDFPEFGKNHEIRLANLRKLAQRASKYGIGIYLYQNEPRAMPNAFFANRPELAGVVEGDFTAMCTSSPDVRRWISNALAHVFREVPELAGVFTITASENLTNCASHGQHKSCPHCRDRSAAEIIAEVNRAIRDGVHRSKPDAKVIAWDWGWNGHRDASDHIAVMPDNMWLMSVSEWGLPIERGGIKSEIGEYSISAVGPGPRASQHWRMAKERGLRTFAKVQFNNTWELASVPYLSVLDLVAEHCHNLAEANIDGLLMSWSLGGYPSLNLQVAHRFSTEPTADNETVLMDLAKEHYGDSAAPSARAAWKIFSEAFQQYPYSGSLVYTGPQLIGPSNPLYLEPTNYSATMVGFPYDDLTSWRGEYPTDTFIQQFDKVAEGWDRGLRKLQAAVSSASEEHRSEAEADLRVAEAALLHFQSVANQSRFVALRECDRKGDLSSEQKEAVREQMKSIAEQEVQLAQRMFRLTVQDSRIGFEASNQYLYLPTDLIEKVVNCYYVIEQLGY